MNLPECLSGFDAVRPRGHNALWLESRPPQWPHSESRGWPMCAVPGGRRVSPASAFNTRLTLQFAYDAAGNTCLV